MEILKGMKLLYAEDYIPTQTVTLKILKKYFDSITVVSNGMQAFEALESEVFDIAILDIIMPYNNGWDVAAKIRELNSDIPIIMVTADAKMDELISGIRLNIIDYLLKPYTRETLHEALNRIVSYLTKKTKPTLCYITPNISYDSSTKQITKNGVSTRITKNEVAMLELLIDYKNSIVTYEAISQNLSYKQDSYSLNAIKTIIMRLRKKVGQETIENISGIGYSLKTNHQNIKG